MATFWKVWLVTRVDGERAYFARLGRACRSGDPRAALISLTAWLGCFFEESPFLSIEEFVDQLCDDCLEAELTSMRVAAEGTSSEWSGNQLYRAVAKLRRRFGADT